MKTHTLLITTILSASVALGVTACHNADSMTGSNARTGDHSNRDAASYDARDTAENFVGNINYARIALAKNKADRAELHVAEAQHLLGQIQDTTAEQRRIERIESGRVAYNDDTDYKYRYFPIAAGPMEIKKLGHGPIWARNDLAVTDADIVYLTVDLSGGNPAKRLEEAEADIKAGKLKAADLQLAKLTNEVVTIDESTSVPVDKARDNIQLARNFVSARNYAGARYALKHADDALNEMQKDDTYATRRPAIIAMRKDVNHLESVITKKDPTMMQQADAKMDKWWLELKGWSHNG